MTKLQYQILASLVLLLIVGVATLHAQPPPPPPPPGDPPCIPVDGGIVFAVGAAAVFGGKKLYSSLKKNKGE
jgi:hypothetical protein